MTWFTISVYFCVFLVVTHEFTAEDAKYVEKTSYSYCAAGAVTGKTLRFLRPLR